jgi:hypothetical protein
MLDFLAAVNDETTAAMMCAMGFWYTGTPNMEAAGSNHSYVSQTTQCHIPEGCNIKVNKLYKPELLLVSFRPSFCPATTHIGLMHKAIYADHSLLGM